MVISFRVAGQPRPKGRPRMSKGGRVYTPSATRRYQRQVCATAKLARHRVLDGALWVHLIAVFRRPKNRPKHVARDMWMDGERIPHTVRPDADNVAKSVLDGLQEARLFEDDSQIVRLVIDKVYAARGEDPHVAVQLGEVDRGIRGFGVQSGWDAHVAGGGDVPRVGGSVVPVDAGVSGRSPGGCPDIRGRDLLDGVLAGVLAVSPPGPGGGGGGMYSDGELGPGWAVAAFKPWQDPTCPAQ